MRCRLESKSAASPPLLAADAPPLLAADAPSRGRRGWARRRAAAAQGGFPLATNAPPSPGEGDGDGDGEGDGEGEGGGATAAAPSPASGVRSIK